MMISLQHRPERSRVAPDRTTAELATPSQLLTVFLALSPPMLVLVLDRLIVQGTLTAFTPTQYLVAALVLFSPLPISLPAVLLDEHRDAALTSLTGPVGRVVRAFALIPWLLVAPDSRCRLATAASLAGFATAAALVGVQVAFRM